MPDTVMCPAGPRSSVSGCAGKGIIDALYNLCDDVADRVNLIKVGVMGESALQYIVRQQDGCLTSGTFNHIKGWMSTAIATGYVKKYAENANGTVIPFPTTPAEVQFLRDCGAFWTSLTEISSCMLLTMPTSGCMSPKLINGLHDALNCMITEECAPCQCPVCGTSEGCQACNSCMTLLVEDSVLGASALINIPYVFSGSSCVAEFNFNQGLRWDASHLEVPKTSGQAPVYSVAGVVHLVKGCGYIQINYGDRSAGNPDDWWAAFNIIEPRCDGSMDPGIICLEWWTTGNPPEPIPVFAGIDIPLYTYDSGAHVTTLRVTVKVTAYMDKPICTDPWKGTAKYYRINMADIPACTEHCDNNVDFPCEGLLINQGTSLTLDNSQGHEWHGKDFNAEVTFDAARCTYILRLWCQGTWEDPETHEIVHGEVTTYQGVKTHCGGPEGAYTPDPDYEGIYPMCFYGDVNIAIEEDTP